MKFGMKHSATIVFAITLAASAAAASGDGSATAAPAVGGEPAVANELSVSIADVQQVRERISARRDEILAENEEARKLDAEIKDIEKSYNEKQAALAKIYASDEKLAEMEKTMDKMFEDIRRAQRAAVAEKMKLRIAADKAAADAASMAAAEEAPKGKAEGEAAPTEKTGE